VPVSIPSVPDTSTATSDASTPQHGSWASFRHTLSHIEKAVTVEIAVQAREGTGITGLPVVSISQVATAGAVLVQARTGSPAS
jgi:hypothetical protein